VPAVLILGSATDRWETSGFHLAVLCEQSPACQAAPELASFLDSIQPAEAGRVERLQASPPALLNDLAADAGLLLVPVAEVLTASAAPQP
jgi:hypothetical protein